MALTALAAAVLTGAGLAQLAAGWLLVRRFAATAAPVPATAPPISVLRPLYGDEPLLEAALASACAQDYPCFQVVFGVQNPADPALAVVRRVQARFPACDIAVVVDDSARGRNRKIANLINMLPAARHDLLVIADSDVHAAPDYLQRIAAALAVPGTGLVTTLYAGLSANASPAARLGASAITHTFLPGALLARLLGRRDALGATVGLRRATLAAVGGFAALRDHLADDNVLGAKVRGLGLDVGLATTVPATTVPETNLAALFRHELRWARTIRSVTPAAAAAGAALQYPLAWAVLALAASGGAPWAIVLAGSTWLARALTARGIHAALGLDGPVPLWHLPLRDLMSVAVLLASFAGDQVEWRGHRLRVDRGQPATGQLGIERL